MRLGFKKMTVADVGVWMQWKIVLVGGVFGPIQLPSRML
jgi:hypothetical protein